MLRPHCLRLAPRHWMAASLLLLSLLLSPTLARADWPRDGNDCVDDARAALASADAALRQAQCDYDDAQRRLASAIAARNSDESRVRWHVDRLNALQSDLSNLRYALDDAIRDSDHAAARANAADAAVASASAELNAAQERL